MTPYPRGVTVTVEQSVVGHRLLVPTGVATPQGEVVGVEIVGGQIERQVTAPGLGLGALVVRVETDELHIRYTLAPPTNHDYPQAAFQPRPNRYTTAAEPLAAAAKALAAAAGGGQAGIQALALEAQSRFSYAHPEERFNDGTDAVPYLACGQTPGSCVDINTYFVASLRAAGYQAAYLYGYFFPAESGGVTHDMHCWVVTRWGDDLQAWDIAHYMKANLGAVGPILNPRPGQRVAMGHSMGHHYPALAIDELKLLAEPLWLNGSTCTRALPLTIALETGP